MVLSFRNIEQGILEGTLDIDKIYEDRKQRSHFESRWEVFYQATASHSEIFSRKGYKLKFLTESLVPLKEDMRPPILMIFGNPAPESVLAKICFASEGNNREHRFWKALRTTGWLSFHSDNQHPLALVERNKIRKSELYGLEYTSPFRIGIAVFFSIPSPASDPKWSGVSGLSRLFGKKALEIIAQDERQRLKVLIQDFVGEHGSIIAFQRDAYERLRSKVSPVYSLEKAQAGDLQGRYTYNDKTLVVGMPPTRLAHTRNFHHRLHDQRISFSEHLNST